MYDSPNLHEASGSGSSSDAIARSTDFWLSDGSIVLQADNTLFRIHLGLLSMNSSFFKDLSRLPQPADQPTTEGCAIIIVHDSSKDWVNLLKWLYHPTRIVSEDFPLDILASMLRLAKKYELDDVRGFVVAHLKSHIPTTIESWVSMESFWTTWVPGKEVELVNIAEEFGMHKILPALYYQCILTIGLHGYEKPNIQMRTDSIMFRLSSRSQKMLLAATSKIHNYIGYDLQDLLDEAEECTSVEKCSIARVELMKLYLGYLGDQNLRFALFPASDVERRHQGKLCPRCHELAADARECNWKETWTILPRVFGINKDWHDLVDFEDFED